jgi:hypothetical protein
MPLSSDPRLLKMIRHRQMHSPWWICGWAVSLLMLYASLYLMPNPNQRMTIGTSMFIFFALLPGIAGMAVSVFRWYTLRRTARNHGHCLCPKCLYPVDSRKDPRLCPECGETYTHEVLEWLWEFKPGPPPGE